MAANSLARRVLKRLLYPFIGEHSYRYLQAIAMAVDIRTGALTEPEVSLIAAAASEGDTVLDIGANYGLYSYHLSRAVGPSGRVYAFEPVPFTWRALHLVARMLRLRNVEIVPKGCSDATQMVDFTLVVQVSGAIAAGLSHMSAGGPSGSREAHVTSRTGPRVLCEVVALDEFLPPMRALSFVKCDVEGAELLVLRGAEKTVSEHKPTLLCEVNAAFLKRYDTGPEELTDWFFSKGYGLYRYEARLRRLIEIPTLRDQPDGNYFFIHPCRRSRFAAVLASSRQSG